MCCTRLAENTGRKKVAKITICRDLRKTAEPIEMPFAMDAESEHHVGTIAQLCWAISSQLKHVSTIGKKTC